MNSLLGSAAALLSAASWALGSILFRRLGDALSPTAMNLTKCLIGLLYLGALLLGFGLEPVGRRDFLWCRQFSGCATSVCGRALEGSGREHECICHRIANRHDGGGGRRGSLGIPAA